MACGGRLAGGYGMNSTATAINVIVIEDDADFCESLADYLRLAGMNVRAFADTAGLEPLLAAEPADIIVLDINLPGESGLEALGRLGLSGRAGVIMLTGRSALSDRLQGLSLGADHYLLKPFDLAELVLVIRNLHARLQRGEPAASWVFDPARWTLVCPEGHAVTLSTQECSLMARLLAEPGRPVSRSDLLETLRSDADGGARDPHLEVLIFRLRRKVEKLCQCELPVQSMRGFGYVFSGPARIVEGVRSESGG